MRVVQEFGTARCCLSPMDSLKSMRRPSARARVREISRALSGAAVHVGGDATDVVEALTRAAHRVSGLRVVPESEADVVVVAVVERRGRSTLLRATGGAPQTGAHLAPRIVLIVGAPMRLAPSALVSVVAPELLRQVALSIDPGLRPDDLTQGDRFRLWLLEWAGVEVLRASRL
jgi:hypothetical protein